MLKPLVVAAAAIAIGPFQVRGVIEGYISVLGNEREFFWSFLILGKQPNHSGQAYCEKTRDESTHGKARSIFPS